LQRIVQVGRILTLPPSVAQPSSAASSWGVRALVDWGLLRDAAKTRRRRRLRYGGSVKMRPFKCRGSCVGNGFRRDAENNRPEACATKPVSRLTWLLRTFSFWVMSELQNSLLELIRRTSAEIPDDVNQAILASLEQEKKGTIAESALKIIDQNIQLAKRKSQPICQDTGSILFYVDCPVGFDQITFEETAKEAVKLATKKGFLRQNSVDSLTGVNDGTNVGPGAPTFHFHQHRSPEVSVRLVLKGGGCENVGAQYSLPNEKLNANRDLDGCRKVILDAVLQAQGKGCGPGILGVCIGGDRATSYEMSKTQFLRLIPDRNPNPKLDALEQDILKTANELGIGPMGFGGKTTLLGVKICAANRLPASYFVSISYMCWAYRRQGVTLDAEGKIGKWLY
jgi:fumarate hydratase, class I